MSPRGYPRKRDLQPLAQEMRAQGLIYREIAERLGVALETARTWVVDPDLSKQRALRLRYAGKCLDCGGPTNGSQGRAKPPKRCMECDRDFKHERGCKRVIDAIQRWADEHGGVPPAATDWNPGLAEQHGHYDRARAHREGDWPGASSLLRLFGSFNAAIEAAGFDPRGVGHYGRDGEDMDLCIEVREYYESGKSLEAVAREYGCTDRGVEYRLRKAGGKPRTQDEARALHRCPS